MMWLTLSHREQGLSGALQCISPSEKTFLTDFSVLCVVWFAPASGRYTNWRASHTSIKLVWRQPELKESGNLNFNSISITLHNSFFFSERITEVSQIDLPLPCRRMQSSIFSPKFYPFKYVKLPTPLNELSAFSLKNKKWSPYKVWLYGPFYQMHNFRIMSKVHAACNSIYCSFISWLGGGSVNPWSTAEDLEFACKACTQQSSWTQLKRSAKSSYPNLTLHYLPGSCCWSLLPAGKRWLSASCSMHHYLLRWRSGKGSAHSISKSFTVFGYGPICTCTPLHKVFVPFYIIFSPLFLTYFVLKKIW